MDDSGTVEADFEIFFHSFPTNSSEKKYVPQLMRIAKREQVEFQVHLDDIEQYFGNDKLVLQIEQNTLRYVNLCSNAIDAAMPQVRSLPMNQRDTLDELAGTPGSNNLPKELMRRYELRFIPRVKFMDEPIPLRKVRSKHIGKLITVKGIVIRITEVKPLVAVCTYTCSQCHLEIYQPIISKTYLPMLYCISNECQNAKSGSRGRLEMQTRGSKFIKYQELRIQEISDQVPIGHVPRSLSVKIHGELTRSASPGDIITLHGIFLPVANEGFRAIKAGMVASTYLLTMGLVQHKKKYSDYVPDATLAKKILDFHKTSDAYGQLASSIAPEIYGMEDVKKALLLQMVGGVTRVMPDGMKIRGDINICLMGDPGVAKSQLLKHISTIAPRAVYTSGKGSSGVGLTAAIIQDPFTKETILEGGSLVLADMGVCCIDEFDKMEEGDRTSIHEVMEQQTISIAKAGITTTLNARTSILAAANPAYGRYNTRKSPTENINLPAALLSRFDLMFLLLDRASSVRDREMAEHITYVHRFKKHPERNYEALPAEFLRAYIARAKKFEPYIHKDLQNFIVDSYISMRQRDYGNIQDDTSAFGYTTARTLLGILRLSQAMARLRFDAQVVQSDIEEAMRLMYQCQAQLRHSKEQDARNQVQVDPITDIYHIIRDHRIKTGSAEVSYDAILPQVLAKHSVQQLDNTLQEYEKLNVWTVDTNKTKIIFIT